MNYRLVVKTLLTVSLVTTVVLSSSGFAAAQFGGPKTKTTNSSKSKEQIATDYGQRSLIRFDLEKISCNEAVKIIGQLLDQDQLAASRFACVETTDSLIVSADEQTIDVIQRIIDLIDATPKATDSKKQTHSFDTEIYSIEAIQAKYAGEEYSKKNEAISKAESSLSIKCTLDFYNTSLNEVVESISEEIDVPIILDD